LLVFRAPILALLLAAAPAASHEEASAPPGPIRCAGTGAPSLRDAASNLSVVRVSTRRAARQEALRGCRRALEALPFAEGGRLGEAAARDEALAQEIRASLRGAREVGAPRFFADGGVALELEVRPTPELASRLAPAAALPPVPR
jgi:hypothetical protein